jgi:drug/metabolite transporter (DMT)-like permease
LKGRPAARLYSLVGFMVLAWSMNFIVGKFALREFPPLLLSCIRTTLAGVCILPVYYWAHRNKKETWTREDLPVLIFLGVFGVAVNQISFVQGLSRTSVAHSAIMIGLTPLMVLLIAAARRQERLTAKKLMGMALALTGVAALNQGGSGTATLTGDLLILLAGFTFAIFTVVGKAITVRHDSITVNTFAYIGGALTLAPATLWLTLTDWPAHTTGPGWAAVIYMALFPSLICYLIYYYALTYIPASRLSALAYLQPLIATGLAAPLLNEPVTRGLALGGGLVLAGVFLTERG